MDAKPDLYQAFLTREGYLPETDAEGNVRFKVQGEVYVIPALGDDPHYFKLSYFHAWDPTTTARALPLLNAITAQVKVAKLVVANNVLCITAETFLRVPEDFEAIFPRCLAVIAAAKSQLGAALQQQLA